MKEKDFDKIKLGDSVFVISIDESALPKNDIIRELTVKAFYTDPKGTHMKITLSDGTVITPSCQIPFHVADKCRNTEGSDIVKPVSNDVYATSRAECIRIAGNLIKLSMSNIHKIINYCNFQLQSLGDCAFILSELKHNEPVEVVSETVVV